MCALSAVSIWRELYFYSSALTHRRTLFPLSVLLHRAAGSLSPRCCSDRRLTAYTASTSACLLCALVVLRAARRVSESDVGGAGRVMLCGTAAVQCCEAVSDHWAACFHTPPHRRLGQQRGALHCCPQLCNANIFIRCNFYSKIFCHYFDVFNCNIHLDIKAKYYLQSPFRSQN